MFLEVIFLACFAAYAVVAFLTTKYLVNKAKYFSIKVLIGLLSTTVFYLILFGDSLVGGWYLDHLCETEGGTHIYQTVELGPEYWREDGSPKYIDIKRGNFNSKIFNNKYLKKRNEHTYSDYIGISYSSVSIVDTTNNQILGERKLFHYGGGWVVNSMSTMAGDACKFKPGQYQKMYEQIFINKTN